MYSLHLSCSPDDVDLLSADLWEVGTAGIRELDYGEEVLLIAGFEDGVDGAGLLEQFAAYSPAWEQEEATDWVKYTESAWPPREIGERVFLAAHWTTLPTPPDRVRVVHNPGLASGTGEHACTQLALQALEGAVTPGCTVADIGAGSGILAIAARQLGAGFAAAIDTDRASLDTAKENFGLNGYAATLVLGSAGCLHDECADVTVANISATVLLAMMDDLLRITKRGGQMILTGFPEWEIAPFQQQFLDVEITALNEWRCLVAKA